MPVGVPKVLFEDTREAEANSQTQTETKVTGVETQVGVTGVETQVGVTGETNVPVEDTAEANSQTETETQVTGVETQVGVTGETNVPVEDTAEANSQTKPEILEMDPITYYPYSYWHVIFTGQFVLLKDADKVPIDWVKVLRRFCGDKVEFFGDKVESDPNYCGIESCGDKVESDPNYCGIESCGISFENPINENEVESDSCGIIGKNPINENEVESAGPYFLICLPKRNLNELEELEDEIYFFEPELNEHFLFGITGKPKIKEVEDDSFGIRTNEEPKINEVENKIPYYRFWDDELNEVKFKSPYKNLNKNLRKPKRNLNELEELEDAIRFFEPEPEINEDHFIFGIISENPINENEVESDNPSNLIEEPKINEVESDSRTNEEPQIYEIPFHRFWDEEINYKIPYSRFWIWKPQIKPQINENEEPPFFGITGKYKKINGEAVKRTSPSEPGKGKKIIPSVPGPGLTGIADKEWCDIYHKLYRQRLLFLFGELENGLANHLVGLMIFLNIEDPTKELFLFICSPGGGMIPGVMVYDGIQYVPSDITTLGLGTVASMASFALLGGTLSKRVAFPHIRVMMHQPHSALYKDTTGEYLMEGVEILRLRENIVRVYAQRTGKPLSVISVDLERDFFMTDAEAKTYGIVDVIGEESESHNVWD